MWLTCGMQALERLWIPFQQEVDTGMLVGQFQLWCIPISANKEGAEFLEAGLVLLRINLRALRHGLGKLQVIGSKCQVEEVHGTDVVLQMAESFIPSSRITVGLYRKYKVHYCMFTLLHTTNASQ